MMQNPARRAPHQGNVQPFSHHAPNAALLIDFDNVTMGIRSDLGKEMKALLNSEVIRGKVAVQRAYADWRRYPQYIVPLAESSIDLIFAPAYGSAKKNATDLRMAIDAIELVFTRPEIGTYILMTGDSDFSSCVLKLKEYGKYVIGVGMRESSSDLLVQNCDEYYSYHALSGLTRTDEVIESKEDPWALLKRAAQQMAARGDVMRTDRLKQVMLEIDPAFDEKAVGYSKFSRFVQEASSKGLLKVRKGENGQYEIVMDAEGGDVAATAAPAAAPAERARREEGDGRRRRGGRGRDRDREERKPAAEADTTAGKPEPIEKPAEAAAAAKAPEEAAPAAATPTVPAREAPAEPAATGPVRDLEQAYGLLQLAVREITGDNGGSIRDGDVKRKMMELSPGFDEGELGFSKFTRFLRQAHDAEAIDLTRANGGNYEVSVSSGGKRFKAPAVSAAPAGGERAAGRAAAPSAAPSRKPEAEEKPAGRRAAAAEKPSRGKAAPEKKAAAERKPEVREEPKAEAAAAAQARPSRGGVGSLSRRGGRPGMAEGPPPILPGQAVGVKKAEVEPEPKAAEKAPAAKKATRTRKPAAKKAAAEAAPAAEKPTKKKASEKAAKKPATRGRKAAKAPAAPAFSAEALGLPRDNDSIVAYLTNSYKGIGQKTADTLVSEFGDDVFRVMNEDPDRVRSAVGARSKGLLEQWSADYTRRSDEQASASPAAAQASSKAEEPEEKPKSRSRRGTRGGRGRKKKEPASS